MYTGHARLKNPEPSDIRPGLSVVAYPDEDITSDSEPFDDIGIGADCDSMEHIYVGVEGGLVVKSDFEAWKKEFIAWLSRTYKEEGDTFAKLDSTLLEWAVGMLWPDQSYVSLRNHRGRQNAGWYNCEFHRARFNMLVG